MMYPDAPRLPARPGRAFAAAVRATPVADRRAWRLLTERWDLFATVLHHHHTAEDEHVWPALVSLGRGRRRRGPGGDGGRARRDRPASSRARRLPPAGRSGRRGHPPRSPSGSVRPGSRWWRHLGHEGRPRRSRSSSAPSTRSSGPRSEEIGRGDPPRGRAGGAVGRARPDAGGPGAGVPRSRGTRAGDLAAHPPPVRPP